MHTDDREVHFNAGNTGMEIETVEIRFTAIGFYAEPSISEHLQKWKGTPSSNLVEDDSGFHKELIQAPVEKAVRISIIKGIKGLPYGSALQSSLRDRLVNNDLFEEEEEEALEKLAEFFQPHNLPKGTNIIYHWATPSSVKVLAVSAWMPSEHHTMSTLVRVNLTHQLKSSEQTFLFLFCFFF